MANAPFRGRQPAARPAAAAASKQTIGRMATIDLPSLGLMGLDARVDTGAKHNALHCSNIRLRQQRGQQQLSFTLLDPKHPAYDGKTYTVTDFTTRRIRTSSGHVEQRFLVPVDVVIDGRRLDKQLFSLADRSSMLFPVLLGRQALAGNFTVDVARLKVNK